MKKIPISAHAGETRAGLPMVELREGDIVIAKMYPNPDGTKLRIVIPELVNMGQTLISDINHLIEFDRGEKKCCK